MTEATAKVLALHPRPDDTTRRLLAMKARLIKETRVTVLQKVAEEMLGDRRKSPISQAELEEVTAMAQNVLNGTAYSIGTDPPMLLNQVSS